MSERVTFTATGDATRGQDVVGGDIYGYREWVYNTLAGYNFPPVSLNVEHGWLGWSDMTLTFDVELVCGVDVPQLREAFASLFAYSEILINPSVRTATNPLNCGNSGGGVINIGNFDGGTVYGGSTPTTGSSGGGNGGTNSAPQNTPSSFEKQMNEIAKWLKDHQTEAMLGGLILVVLLMRK